MLNLWLNSEFIWNNDVPCIDELNALKGVPQPEKWHPEGDAYVHTLMVLEQAEIRYPKDIELALAAICHDLGKALTQRTWPSHYGHENYGIKPTKSLLTRLGVEQNIINRIAFTTKYHMHVHKVGELRPTTYLKMWNDAPGDKFESMILLAKLGECDHFGRGDHHKLTNLKNNQSIKLIQIAALINHLDKGQDLLHDKNAMQQIRNLA